METKMSSNDFGSRADNSYKKNFDYQIDKMIESYLGIRMITVDEI